MNDFTKEELGILIWGLEMAGVGGGDLRFKIDNMVDNYCEHEWRQSPRLNWLYDCMKCRKEICKKCVTSFRKKDDN